MERWTSAKVERIRSLSRVPRLRDWSVVSRYRSQLYGEGGGGGGDEQVNRARMVVGSSPTRRRGSILKLAPWSSPTSSSESGIASGELEELLEALRGMMYPDRLTWRLAVAMGRESRAMQCRVVGRRMVWRDAIVDVFFAV